jgi:hypothetical protein
MASGALLQPALLNQTIVDWTNPPVVMAYIPKVFETAKTTGPIPLLSPLHITLSMIMSHGFLSLGHYCLANWVNCAKDLDFATCDLEHQHSSPGAGGFVGLWDVPNQLIYVQSMNYIDNLKSRLRTAVGVSIVFILFGFSLVCLLFHVYRRRLDGQSDELKARSST